MVKLVCVLAFLLGDVVYLVDGTTVEGEVTRRGGRVIVRMRSGVTVSYSEEEIVKIVSSSSVVGDYARRCSLLSDWDARGWLELGEWCLGRGMKKEARECFEKACSTATEQLPEAARKLAGLLEEAGELRRASEFYGMLETSFSDAGARRKRVRVQKRLLERFQKVLQSAQRALAVGNVGKAIKLIGVSREAWPPQADEEAIHFLREVRRAEEDKLMRLRAPVCGKCSGAGRMTCPDCNGRKTVWITRRVVTKYGVRRRQAEVSCARCKRKGKFRCTGCEGSGYDMSAYQASHRRAAQELFRACNTNAARPLQLGIPALHKRIADIARRLPPGLEPSYGGSMSLRTAAGSVPFKRAPAAIASRWRLLPLRQKERFFRAYALETAEVVKALPPETPLPDSAEELARMSEPVDEMFLSAAEEKSRWVSLTIELEKAEKVFDSALLRIWTLPSGLALYAWKETGWFAREVLAEVVGSKGLARRARSSDPGLPARIEELQGQTIRARGLFHRCPLLPPCARIELWQVELRADEETERMLATGRKRVTFRFERTPLRDAVALLAALTRAKIRSELPGRAELEVSLSARNEFLAIAVDKLARKAKLPWGFDQNGIVVGRAGDVERTKKVLHLLGGE